LDSVIDFFDWLNSIQNLLLILRELELYLN
jgi:hypothetical protein